VVDGSNYARCEMTTERKQQLLLSADQADAHGHVERARWYRVWAEAGAPVGEKPEAVPRGLLGIFAPVS
jgi:hypothetical protein